MYTVHVSKAYTVSSVRERLSDALDEAELGVPVFIERRGVRYQLSVAPAASRRPSRRKPRIEVLDPAVAEGRWTWEWTAEGLQFQARQKK